jgi:hypothetical protein
MRKLLLASWLAGAGVYGATSTVCATGCTYNNLQTALNAVVPGDVLELKAGEVFEGFFYLPFKSGNGTITVRTSRWRELPPPGTRVTAATAAIMPRLQPINDSGAALSAGYGEKAVTTADVTTDVFTFSGNHGFVDGDPIACRSNSNGVLAVTLNQVYYVRDATATTLKLAQIPGGPAVDLVTPTPTGDGRCTMARSIRGWTFQGIEFSVKSGQPTQYNLVEIGNGEANAREGLASNITFDRVYIHGIQGQSGPRTCLVLNTNASAVIDSRIEHCNKEGEEGKALASWQTPGPVLVRNNYIDGGSINMLVGGSYVTIDGMVNGDNGGFLIEGNHFTRPLATKYTRGGGGTVPPSGACGDGGWYLNASTGAWSYCNGGSWIPGPTCADGEYYRRTDVTQSCAAGACWQCSNGVFAPSSVYRGSGYFTKNLFEIKSIKDVVIRGNIFENNWTNGDQSGVAVWITSQVAQYNANAWVRGENIRFERNIVRNSPQGIRIASEGSTVFGVPNNRLQLYDNLAYKIGITDYPSVNSNDARPLSLAGPCDDCVLDHNTIMSGVNGGSGIYFDTRPMQRFRMSNQISNANQYGVLGDLGQSPGYYMGVGNMLNSVLVDSASSQGAPSSVGSYAVSSKFITPATSLFVGGGDYRLSPTSPYSAACASGCDFKGTDGKDLGADADLVTAQTSGVETGVSRLAQLRLLIDAGSRYVVVRYTAPDANACTLQAFTNLGRTLLITDTTGAGNQTDTRAGNTASGRRREFVLGTVSQLTPGSIYYGLLQCGTLRVPLRLQTKAAGAVTLQHEVRLAQAQSLQYATNPAFTGATTLSAATRHLIPLAPGGLVYYRVGSNPATVVAGP